MDYEEDPVRAAGRGERLDSKEINLNIFRFRVDMDSHIMERTPVLVIAFRSGIRTSAFLPRRKHLSFLFCWSELALVA